MDHVATESSVRISDSGGWLAMHGWSTSKTTSNNLKLFHGCLSHTLTCPPLPLSLSPVLNFLQDPFKPLGGGIRSSPFQQPSNPWSPVSAALY